MPKALLLAAAAIGLVSCGGTSPDAALRKTLSSGVAEIRRTPEEARLDRELAATIAALRREEAQTGAARRGRRFAIAGFVSTRRGLETQLSMRTHDSGKLEAAVRDARRADRELDHGARLLRAAGRALGLRIGNVNGR